MLKAELRSLVLSSFFRLSDFKKVIEARLLTPLLPHYEINPYRRK